MNGVSVRAEVSTMPLVASGYCYDADLVAAVITRRKQVSLTEAHKINNLLMHYMAYSGYYGVDIPVQAEKAAVLQGVFEEWLISKLM